MRQEAAFTTTRRAALVGAVATAFAGEAWAQAPRFRPGSPWAPPRPNASLPLDMVFRTADGDTTLEALLAGRPAVINLWATWCGPCRMEKPALNRLARQEAARGDRVAILSVLAFDDDVTQPDEIAAAYRRFNAPALRPLRATAETERVFVRYFGSGAQRHRTALPSTALIDPTGRDLGRIIGAAVLGASQRPYWTDPLAEQMFDRLVAAETL